MRILIFSLLMGIVSNANANEVHAWLSDLASKTGTVDQRGNGKIVKQGTNTRTGAACELTIYTTVSPMVSSQVDMSSGDVSVAVLLAPVAAKGFTGFKMIRSYEPVNRGFKIFEERRNEVETYNHEEITLLREVDGLIYEAIGTNFRGEDLGCRF